MGIVAPEIYSLVSSGLLVSSGFARSAIDIGVEFSRVGLGGLLREVGGRIDDLAHLGVDGLQILLAHLCRQQPVAHLLDRIVIVPYLVDLLAGAIFRRVRHRMAAV